MKLLAVITAISLSFFLNAHLSPKELAPLVGEWKGTLTYIDYTSGKQVSIPAEISARQDEKNEHAFIVLYKYPEEPQENEYDTLTISSNGKMINDKKITSKTVKDDGNLVFVAEKQGEDNDKPATLRYTYTLGKKQFIIRKEIRFAGETNFSMRNEFSLHR